MSQKLLLIRFYLLALPLLPLLAAAQTLDPTFAPPASLYSVGTVYSMGAQQADGKRVVAGAFTRINNVAVGSLARLDATGALDATFAQNVGVARSTFRVKTLPNGQYLVSGFYNDLVTAGGLTRTALLRLNASGTADASFNAGTGAASTSASAIQLSTFIGQPDGKVLVGGSFDSFSGQNTKSLVRLNADGSLDTAFNTNLGTGFSGPVNTLVVQPDGKIVVGGTFTMLNGQSTAPLVRLNADGTRDASFTAPIGQSSYVGSLLVQPDGKILATGYFSINSTNSSIVRFTATGAVDTGFAAPASTITYSSSYFDANVLLQPDGKVLLAGGFVSSNNGYLVRLNADGTPDNSFTSTNSASQYPYSIGLQSDGSVWLGGSFSSSGGRETPLIRLVSTGAPDPAFLPNVQAPGSVTAVVQQADGQLVLGGEFTEYNGVAVRRLVRVSATGTLDAAYAAAIGNLTERVQALALQPDGKLLVGTRGGLRRLLTTGSLDASFGTFAASTSIEALTMQPDGKALALGYFNNIPGSTATQYLVRLTTSGAFDSSFNPGTANAPGTTFYLTALALQPDGKVLVGGSFLPATGSSTALRVVRYESTGAVDAAFSTSTPFAVAVSAAGTIVRFNTLAVQPDGKVLVGGYFATVSGVARTNLARLSATGQLDATFAPATLTGAVATVALQANGRVLVGSSYGNDGAATTTPLVRLLDTGASDPSFGTPATPDGPVAALLVQPNGAAVVGGSFTTIGGQPARGVARLVGAGMLAGVAPAAPGTLSVWPVPAHGLLHATSDAGAQAAELLDALGRIVRQQALRGASEFTMTVENLPAGLYMLRVRYASGATARRVAIE